MTMLWTSVALLTAAVIGVLLWSTLRKNGNNAATRAAFDIAVYKDQLSELQHDLERGLINQTEVESARTEIERRILALSEEASEVADTGKISSSLGRNFSTVIIVLAMPALTFGVYLFLGTPDYPNTPFASRDLSAEKARSQRLKEAAEMAGLIDKLAERLEEDPNNLRGWLLLGRTYLTMEREADAVAALRKAVELAPKNPDVAMELGEALIVSNDNRVGPESRTILNGVLSSDARSPRARYYLALADAQDGNLKNALQGWTDLLAVSPANAPWRATVMQSIRRAAEDLKVDPASIKPSLSAKLLGPGKASPAQPLPTDAPGPTQKDMEAAGQMSAGDRTEMIKGMVQRLADKLKDNPDDLAGWQRLARAYSVLGETEKAKHAEQQIQRLSQ
jgi:cytochrome c-type biogenesis protein CcmH